jgi:hypothetical protein
MDKEWNQLLDVEETTVLMDRMELKCHAITPGGDD